MRSNERDSPRIGSVHPWAASLAAEERCDPAPGRFGNGSEGGVRRRQELQVFKGESRGHHADCERERRLRSGRLPDVRGDGVERRGVWMPGRAQTNPPGRPKVQRGPFEDKRSPSGMDPDLFRPDPVPSAPLPVPQKIMDDCRGGPFTQARISDQAPRSVEFPVEASLGVGQESQPLDQGGALRLASGQRGHAHSGPA